MVLGTFTWVSFFFLSTHFANLLNRDKTGALFYLETIFFIFISGFVIFAIVLFSGRHIRPFVISPYFLFVNRKYKWVYHVELGHYMLSIVDDELKLYQVNPFYFKCIHTIQNSGDVDHISRVIKSKLDDIYKDKLRIIKRENDKKKNADNILQWDGYLDKQGRRDGKIKEILGDK